MFDDPRFTKHKLEEILLGRDLYLMDEEWLGEYERAWIKTFEGGDSSPYEVGYVSFVAARNVSAVGMDLSWYPNFFSRFHEVKIFLPREEFVVCVECRDYDDKPRIFVKSGWLDHLYLRSFSIFALVDAIGVKAALKEGRITRPNLLALRDCIDSVAERHPDVSIISFADSVVLKTNWHVGLFTHGTKYSYKPEAFIGVVQEIVSAYRQVLGLDAYAVLTQGSNAYYEDSLLHISSTKNHISLNSLGLPFAQVLSIEKAAKKNIAEEAHNPAELYLDENFFHSLNFVFEFQKDTCGKHVYREPLMQEEGFYFSSSFGHVLKNLRGPDHGANGSETEA